MESIPETIEDISEVKEEAGKVIARLVEILHEKRENRREAKKLRDMLKTLPIQCRASYIKLM